MKEKTSEYRLLGDLFLRLLPLCMPWAVWTLIYVPYAQAAEKKVISVLLPIMDGLVGVVVCSFFLIPRMQMNGLYIANILNGMISSALIYISAWITIKRMPRSMEDVMAIPERIGAGPDQRIDIRDNCGVFDPSEYNGYMQPGEAGRNMGIRIVYSIAKKVEYQNLLGMNVLTMRI